MDISKYTNNEKRRAFFDERNEDEGWYLWFEEQRLNRKYMRCDIDGISFIAELREQTLKYPRLRVELLLDSFYMVNADEWEKPFEDHRTTVSAMIDELKRLQKDAKKQQKEKK